MDPVQNAVSAILHAVQALEGSQQAAPQAVLTALQGQEVRLTFQGSSPDGLQFSLPSGQTVTAQGSFPYPEGTQVT